jgi:hypothetical protein
VNAAFAGAAQIGRLGEVDFTRLKERIRRNPLHKHRCPVGRARFSKGAVGCRMPGGNIVTWGAQSVRSTLFTNAFNTVTVQDLFLKAFDQQPSSYQGSPSGMPFASEQAAGLGKLGQLSLQKLPGRIDVILSPNFPPVPTGSMVTIGDVIGALDLVQKTASELSSGQNAISRLALYAEFCQSTNDRVDANRIITSVMPISIELSDEVDFSLQYTIRSQSTKIENVKINKLLRWNVLEVLHIMQTFPMNTGTAQSARPFLLPQVVFDVNTTPDGPAIAGSDAAPIFVELRKKIDDGRRGEWGG